MIDRLEGYTRVRRHRKFLCGVIHDEYHGYTKRNVRGGVSLDGQRSGASPLYSSTTTDPSGKTSLGKLQMKKNIPAIVAAHGIPYDSLRRTIVVHDELVRGCQCAALDVGERRSV